MKSIPKLVLDLQAAESGSRRWDSEIAKALGYERKIALPKHGKPKIVYWTDSRTGIRISIPHYSTSVDAAAELIELLLPGASVGFTWADIHCSARIDEGSIFIGSTPALALCAAALSTMRALGEV